MAGAVGPWIGLNASRTQDGREQIDGACAFLVGDSVHAIAEERLSGIKHDGNCRQAIDHGLRLFGLTSSAIEKAIVSTCGEEALSSEAVVYVRMDGRLTLEDMGIEARVIEKVDSHHESHAWEALFSAHIINRLYQPCLVYVADRVGQPAEHQSLYLFNDNRLSLIWRDTERKDLLPGLGETYDHITKHLGWRENIDAGKTMALAGMHQGRLPASRNLFFSYKSNRINTLAPRVSDTFTRMLNQICPQSPDQHTKLTKGAFLAVWLQRELEAAVIQFLEYWVGELKPVSILFSGGMAANCKLLGTVFKRFPHLYVQGSLMPGDTGQCVGNIIGYYYKTFTHFPKGSTSRHRPVFWPDTVSGNSETSKSKLPVKMVIPSSTQRKSPAYIRVITDKTFSLETAADHIVNGDILAVCLGDLEPGPRALGFHSLLADPRNRETIQALNEQVKKREPFRPFGVIMTPRSAYRYFGVEKISPYMDIALPAGSRFQDDYPSVIHRDHTIRIQVLCSLTEESFTGTLLRYLEKTTGRGVLINTSLNQAGHPIHYSPYQLSGWNLD